MRFVPAKSLAVAALFLVGSASWANSIPVRSKSSYGTSQFQTVNAAVSETTPDGFVISLDCSVSEGCFAEDGNYQILSILTPSLPPGTMIDITGIDPSVFNPSGPALLCEGTGFLGSCTGTEQSGTMFQTPITNAQQLCVDSVGDNYNSATNTLKIAAPSCGLIGNSGDTQMFLLFSVDTLTLPDISITTAPAAVPEPSSLMLLSTGLLGLLGALRRARS
jgi:hypothetical protein